MRDIGRARLGMTVAERLRRKTKITSTTRTSVSSIVNRASLNDALIGRLLSNRMFSSTAAGSCFWKEGSSALTASATSTVFRPGWRCTARTIARCWPGGRAVPGGGLVVLHAVEHLAEVGEPDRRAVPVRDDQRLVILRPHQLAVRLHGERALRAVQDAGGQVDVAALDRIRHLVQPDAPGGQRLRIDLDADGVFLRAEHLDLGHAVYHGNPLGQDGLAVFVERGQRQCRAGQRDHQDRLVRRIHLLVGRGRRHVRRQIARHPCNGGLDILRRRVDVPGKGELKSDGRGALGAGGTHRIHPRRSWRTGAPAPSPPPTPWFPDWPRAVWPRPGSSGNPRWADR